MNFAKALACALLLVPALAAAAATPPAGPLPDDSLYRLEDTLTDQDTPATVRTAVQSYLPQVKAQHDLMRDKKWAMESSRH